MGKTFFKPPIVAIDFDGTIADNEYPEIGELKDGVKEFMELIKNKGWRITIWTCRQETHKVEKFLNKHNLPYDGINENILTQEELDEYGFVDTRKIGADFYIDDKSIEFRNNWHELIDKFKRCVEEW